MLIQRNLSVQEKLRTLTDAAKYDMTYTSSGVRRKGKADNIGNTSEAGICHSLSADGRCISPLKILSTDQCIYDCEYYVNRCSNDVAKTTFTPDEVCELTIEFYRRDYIEELFLSSGTLCNTDHTVELIYETLYKLRNQWYFNGYIHAKAIPGVNSKLVERMGSLAGRTNINLEPLTAEGLKNLAPGKTRDKILKSMRQVQRGIVVFSRLLRYDKEFKKTYVTERAGFAGGAALVRPELVQPDTLLLGNHGLSGSGQDDPGDGQRSMERAGRERRHLSGSRYARAPFVPTGQGTQMIMGIAPENDCQMMVITRALYENYDLRRVFYSTYVTVDDDSCLPSVTARPPLLRERRLYQADWLFRFYGSKAEELLSEEQPDLNVFLDPKCDWALRHLELFPVEISRASYEGPLRVPGIGVKSAQRIVNTRRQGRLLFEDLKKMGVVLKRARYFITCKGYMMEDARLGQGYITSYLVGDKRRKTWDTKNRDSFRQLNLLDDMYLEIPMTSEDHYTSVAGSL